MRNFFSILFIGGICFLFSCGPSTEQKAEGEEAATESMENMTTETPQEAAPVDSAAAAPAMQDTSHH